MPSRCMISCWLLNSLSISVCCTTRGSLRGIRCLRLCSPRTHSRTRMVSLAHRTGLEQVAKLQTGQFSNQQPPIIERPDLPDIVQAEPEIKGSLSSSKCYSDCKATVELAMGTRTERGHHLTSCGRRTMIRDTWGQVVSTRRLLAALPSGYCTYVHKDKLAKYASCCKQIGGVQSSNEGVQWLHPNYSYLWLRLGYCLADH